MYFDNGQQEISPFRACKLHLELVCSVSLFSITFAYTGVKYVIVHANLNLVHINDVLS